MTISVKQSNTYAAATGVWVKVNGVWKQVATSGLDGLGSWALLKRATGSPKRYQYTASGTTWVAYEWTAPTGSLTTDAGGLVDALVVGAGGNTDAGYSYSGTGGGVLDSVSQVGTTATVTVGQSGAGHAGSNNAGGFSQLGDLRIAGGSFAQQRKGQPNGYLSTTSGGYTAGAGAGGDAPNADTGGAGHSTAITSATPQVYARGGGKAPHSSPRPGDGADRQNNGGTAKGIAGVVIVRVPKDFDNIPSSDWVTRIDYYAEVTDGIVTDLYQERFYGDDTVRTENGRYASPEQPDDLIPCDPHVAEGWTYADGEFTPPPPPPPPSRDELIEALKQQLKDLEKDQA